MRSLVLVSAALGSLAAAPAAIAQTGPAQTGPASPQYATGATWSSSEDVEGIPIAPLTRAYIPEAISLADRFPEPGDQNPVGSCVAWATAYAARSYYNVAPASPPVKPVGGQIASPAHLYNLLFVTGTGRPGAMCKDAGSNIGSALKLLRQHGVLSHQDYGYANVCAPERADPSLEGPYRVTGYEPIAWDPPRASRQYVAGKSTPLNLDRVRLKLAAGHPVLFSMEVGPAFMSLRAGQIYDDVAANAPKEKRGGHAMVVIGYDDRRQAFHIINSWGRDWADSGYGWISYKSFLTDVREAFVMNVGVAPPVPVPTRPATEPPRPPEVASLQCADVRTDRIDGGGLKFTGFVKSYDDLRKLDGIVGDNLEDFIFGGKGTGSVVENAVVVRPWPVCEAMLTLKAPMQAPSRPEVSIVGGSPVAKPARGRSPAADAVALKIGNTFAIKITAPDVPSYLYAFYIEDDGTVRNLIPRRAPIRKQTPAGEEIVIGGGQQGQPTFRTTKPKSELEPGNPMRGHEAVVVIAARAPVQQLEDQEKADSKPGSAYYEVAAKSEQGPPDRLFLSLLRDITLQRAESDRPMLPREVSAAIVHIKIEE